MSDIPNELYGEILSYLPAEPLLRFRCVCKGWRSLIDDFGFIKLQLIRQKDSQQVILKKYQYGTQLYTLPLKSVDCSEECSNSPLKSVDCSEECSKSIEVTPFKILTRLGVPRVAGMPLASCDGLLLFSHEKEEKIWALWNPFTREFLELPPPPPPGDVTPVTWDVRIQWLLCGLGYDAVTDDYKVVKLAQFYSKGSSWLETFIFSVKLDCWRRIDNSPNCSRPSGNDPLERAAGVFLNGALHWITYEKLHGVAEEWVLSFDLGSETYSLLPMPLDNPEPENRFYTGNSYIKHLDVLSGSLFLSCYNYNGGRLDMWMMKDYGEKCFWNKLFSLTRVIYPCRPIAFRENEEVLIQYKDEFVWFDVEKKSAKKLSIKGLPDEISSQVLPASLVRLNNSGRAGKQNDPRGKTGRKRKRDHEKMQLTLTATDFQLPFADCLQH